MDTQKYFNERFDALALEAFKKADKSEAGLVKMFRGATKNMNKEIDAFYGKYGKIVSSPTFKQLKSGIPVVTGKANKLAVSITEANEYNRIFKLEAQLKKILNQLARDQNSFMYTQLGEIASGSYYDTIFTLYKGYGAGTSFSLLDPKLVKQLIENPVFGENFSSRVWNNKNRLANVVNQELKNGLIQGISNQEMTERLSKRMNSSISVANRLIKTEVNNSYAQASLLGYKESGVVDEYFYTATLDSRTSKICTDLDNYFFKVEEAVTGLNYPPAHPRCRSTTRAKFDEGVATRIARNADTSKNFTVPSDMSARDFKAIYVDKTVKRSQFDAGKRL